MSSSHPYPKARPIINAFAAMAMAAASVIFLSLSGDIGLEWTSVFAASVFAAVIVVYVTPLVTDHLVVRGELRLRYGLFFVGDIPLSSIKDARAMDAREKVKGALDLTTEKSRRVLLTLAERRRFPHALWRSYDSVLVSVEDVAGFVKAVGGDGREPD